MDLEVRVAVVKNDRGFYRACCMIVADVPHNLVNSTFVFRMTKPILATPLPNPPVVDPLGNTVYVLGRVNLEYRVNGEVAYGEFKVVGNVALDRPLQYDLVIKRDQFDEKNMAILEEGESKIKKSRNI